MQKTFLDLIQMYTSLLEEYPGIVKKSEDFRQAMILKDEKLTKLQKTVEEQASEIEQFKAMIKTRDSQIVYM